MKTPFLLAAGLLCGAALLLTGCAADVGESTVQESSVPDPVGGVNGADHHKFTFDDGTVMYCVFWDPGFGQEGGEQLECSIPGETP